MPRALSKVRPWLSANKVDFTVFQDPTHEVINALSIIAVPTVIVLDRNGLEDFRSAGFFGSGGKVVMEHLRKLLAAKPEARGFSWKVGFYGRPVSNHLSQPAVLSTG